jgi:hypothetical protein
MSYNDDNVCYLSPPPMSLMLTVLSKTVKAVEAPMATRTSDPPVEPHQAEDLVMRTRVLVAQVALETIPWGPPTAVVATGTTLLALPAVMVVEVVGTVMIA